jgi:hypothetical protein
MSDPKQAAQGSAATAQRLKFHEMSPGQKMKFVLKLVVCMISFGFLYPHILID